jgi:hypothetical protein
MKSFFGRSSFLSGIVIGTLLVGMLMAIGIWITVRIPVALNEPPVSYADVTLPALDAVCAGDVVSFTATVSFKEAGLNQTYTSIRTMTGRNVLGTQGQMGTRLQPAPAQFRDVIMFEIPPELPPGDYQHVRATVAVNKDSEPAFLVIPFSVAKCAQ